MIQMLPFEHSLAFLRTAQAKRRPLANHMSLPHQYHEEEKREHREEAHHAIHPADINDTNPLVDIEIDAQPHDQSHTIDRDDRLARMLPEALADIVDRNRNANQAADRDENLANRKNHPVQMIQQRGAHHAQANRLQDKARQPQRMQAILGLPRATVAGCEPERDAIAEIVPVDQAREEADPVHECEGGVLRDGEAVAAGFDRLLQPDGRQGI
jgi:hypothetical protein